MIELAGGAVEWHRVNYAHEISGTEQTVQAVEFCLHPDTLACGSLVLVLEGLGGSKHSLAKAVGSLPGLPLVGVQLDFSDVSDAGIEATLGAGPKAADIAAKELCGIDTTRRSAIAGSSIGCGKALKIVSGAPGEWGDIVFDKLLIAHNGLSAQDIAVRVNQNIRGLAESSDPEVRIEQPGESLKAKPRLREKNAMEKLDYAVRQPGLTMFHDLVDDDAMNRGRDIVVSMARDDTVARPGELLPILNQLQHPERIIYHEGSGGHYAYVMPGGIRQLAEAILRLPRFDRLDLAAVSAQASSTERNRPEAVLKRR